MRPQTYIFLFVAFWWDGSCRWLGGFGYCLESVECHLKTYFLICFPGVTGQEEAIESLSPLSPFPTSFVSCPFCRWRGFFCVFFFLCVLHP